MEWFKFSRRFDFMRLRFVGVGITAVLILASTVSLVAQGLNFGVDFTGGTLVELGYQRPADLAEVRIRLNEAGFSGAGAQHFGTAQDVLIRLPPSEENTATLGDRVFKAMNTADNPVELRRVEFVGPQVGEELAEDGGLAVLYALIGILIYVALRFEFRFAIGAVVATIHDVIITVGAFAITQVEFDLATLAAVLAVIGYSLNDTIVVYDRIRENFRKLRRATVMEVCNLSINETLSRTIMTSGTTLIVVLALALLGGKLIFGFALALIVGIIIGTFSSIYVAAALLVWLGVTKADLAVPKKSDLETTP